MPASPPHRRRPALIRGVLEDIQALPSQELRTLAFRLLLEIEAGTITGRPLDSRAHVGDLSDCFKVYFDHPRGDRPSYRIVYRLNEGVDLPRIQAIAIGRRESLAVYYEAVRRLRET